MGRGGWGKVWVPQKQNKSLAVPMEFDSVIINYRISGNKEVNGLWNSTS